MGRRNFSDFKFSFALLFSAVLGVNATVLTSTVSKNSITIGDKVLFTVSAVIPKGATITPPSTDSALGNIVVKNWTMHKTEREKYDSLAFEYILTTYTPENCTIPELSFVQTYNSTSDTLKTQSIPLEIRSVLSGADSTIQLKDLKPQRITGKAPKWWLWILAVMSGIALITILIRYLAVRFRKAALPPPPKPAYEEAIEALAVLHGKRLLQQGLIREYVFELSEIFKRYIGRRFGVNAEEFTTEEMIAWLGISPLQKKTRNNVEWFFKTTDPVKFARYTPDDSTLERFGKEVVDFLELTKPLPETSKPNSSTENTTGTADSAQVNPVAVAPESTGSGENT